MSDEEIILTEVELKRQKEWERIQGVVDQQVEVAIKFIKSKQHEFYREVGGRRVKSPLLLKDTLGRTLIVGEVDPSAYVIDMEGPNPVDFVISTDNGKHAIGINDQENKKLDEAFGFDPSKPGEYQTRIRAGASTFVNKIKLLVHHLTTASLQQIG